MAKQVWQSVDGSIHDTQAKAELIDLRIQVAETITQRGNDHDISVEPEEVELAARILVETDALAAVNALLRDKL